MRQNFAVLVEGGNLKAFGRMDGAPILEIDGCQRKACTALYGISTEDLYQRIKDDPSRLIGLSHFSRATVVGGSLPIRRCCHRLRCRRRSPRPPASNEFAGGYGLRLCRR